MGFWDLFKSKKTKEKEDYEAEVEALTQKIRKNRVYFLKQKLKRLKEKQEEMALEDEIDDLEDEIYGDEDDEETEIIEQADSPEAVLNSLLTKAFTAKSNKSPVSNAVGVSSDIGGSGKKMLTDEELRAFKEKIPAQNLAAAKAMPEADLIPIVSEQLAGCDDATIARAIKILKE